MNKRIKGFIVVMVATVLLFSALSTAVFAVNADNILTSSADSNKNVVTVKAASNKVTWNANGGKFATKKTTTTTTVKKGSKIKKFPTSPKRTDYSLKGWYTKKSGGTKITTNTVPKKKVTYYAQWLKKYTLTFDPNGGKVTTKTKKIAKTKAIGTLPKPTKSGYTFTGWYTTKTGTKKISTTTKMPSQNLKVYAHWKKGSSNTNRVLNTNEKELIGEWIYGNIHGGENSGAYATSYNFKNDGTYLFKSIASGSYYTNGGGVVIETGKWSVSSKGILNFKDRIQSYTLWNGKKEYVNKQYPDQTKYYVTETIDGKKGIRVSYYSLEDAKTDYFHEKQ